jgi:hypothetical protein
MFHGSYAGGTGDQDCDEAGPSSAGDPLAALLDQILADLDAGQVARARATVAAIRRRVDGRAGGD